MRTTSAAFLVSLALLAAGTGRAQTFKILDITPDLTGLNVEFFSYQVAMNGSGVVAFSGIDLTGASRSVIYASDGESTWEAFSGPTSATGELVVGSINDSNKIAVKKHVFNGPESIGVLANGSVQIISPNVLSAGIPAINNLGDVVYLKLTNHYVESATVNLVSHGSASEIAKVDYNPVSELWRSKPTLNDAGTIVGFVVISVSQGTFGTIAVWENGTRSFPLFDGTSYVYYSDVALNNPGDIAYVAERSQDQTSLEVLHVDTTISPLLNAGPGQQFRYLGEVGIADNGDVAIQAVDSAWNSTLLLHRYDQFLPIVSTGDILFGSAIKSLYFSGAVNSRGQVAFSYDLADGRKGFARAELIPEPSTAGTVAFVLLTLAISVRLQRQIVPRH